VVDCSKEACVETEEDEIHKQYDWSDTDPSIAVVKTVAAATNREPTELKPLYEILDPDALDELIRSDGRPTATDTSVSFIWDRCNVTVNSSGDVVVCPSKINI
jgi:hypothetical protein